MLIGFAGASGRTDASHVALLAASTLATLGERVTLLAELPAFPQPTGTASNLHFVRVRSERRGFAAELRRSREAYCAGGWIAVADLPVGRLVRADVREAFDVAIVVVGPHELDECEAARLVRESGGGAAGPRPWYLGCRRAGGAPAAARFAQAMARLDEASATLPLALPPFGRGEAAALSRGLQGRALGLGLALVAAVCQAAAAMAPDEPPLLTRDLEEARRIAAGSDARTLADRLRDLADDVESVAAGFGPAEADLAGATVLDGWSQDVVATPILKGRVSGHPDIPEGRRVRTSEVFLTDRQTWARTLSRWYVLRAPQDGPAANLQ